MPGEKDRFNTRPKEFEKVRTETVMMERCYLKAWQIFKEHTEKLLPRFA